MPESIAILGGTGAQGFGLALRWAAAGVPLLIGSRELDRAGEAARRLAQQVAGAAVQGLRNEDAAARAQLVVLTVPLNAQVATLKSVRDHLRPGTVLVDATVPVGAAIGERIARLVTPWGGSAAQQAAANLPDHVTVVAAFHSLSATALSDLSHEVNCDVLVCGDNKEARQQVSTLAAKIAGVRPIDGGPLENARYAEHIAGLLISLNVRYKVKHSGVRFTGLGV